MEKQVCKLKLLKKQKIYDVFFVSLLKQDTTKKRRVDKDVIEFKADGDGEEYEMEEI